MMKLIFFLIMLNMNLMMNFNKMLNFFIYNLLFLMSIIYIMNVNFNNYWMCLYNWMGMDNLSNILIILSIWVICFVLISKKNFMNLKFYNFMLLFLLINLILTFYSLNYMMFYMFFEISLIPTFFLIMIWGYQPERINSSIYMLMYTMFGSLPLFLIIFYLYNFFDSLMYIYIINKMMNYKIYSMSFYIFMILAYLIKLPMFMFHIWLPKAHLEAPVSGSMILAGIMLKLGGYGIIRSMMMMMNYSLKFNYVFLINSLIGLIFLSILCLRLYDMKLLIAYSSVVHMSIMLIGLMMLNKWSLNGSLLLMFSHGLCSPMLFFLANLFYERSKSRNMLMNKGLMNYSSMLVMWWFLFCIINMSAPISMNLLSELMIINSILNWSFNMIFFFMLSMLISAIYTIYLFIYLIHGKNYMIFKFYQINMNNYILMIMNWILLNFMLLKMNYFF